MVVFCHNLLQYYHHHHLFPASHLVKGHLRQSVTENFRVGTLLWRYINPVQGQKSTGASIFQYPDCTLLNGTVSCFHDVAKIQPEPYSADDDNTLLSLLAKRGIHLQSIEELVKLLKPDDYEAELRVAAEVAAYFKVSYKRVIDVIPMFIESEFIRGFSLYLRQSLAENLGLIGGEGLEKCARFAVDESTIQRRRWALSHQLDILVNATDILGHF